MHRGGAQVYQPVHPRFLRGPVQGLQRPEDRSTISGDCVHDDIAALEGGSHRRGVERVRHSAPKGETRRAREARPSADDGPDLGERFEMQHLDHPAADEPACADDGDRGRQAAEPPSRRAASSSRSPSHGMGRSERSR